MPDSAQDTLFGQRTHAGRRCLVSQVGWSRKTFPVGGAAVFKIELDGARLKSISPLLNPLI